MPVSLEMKAILESVKTKMAELGALTDTLVVDEEALKNNDQDQGFVGYLKVCTTKMMEQLQTRIDQVINPE